MNIKKSLLLLAVFAAAAAFAARARVEINGQAINMNSRDVSCSPNIQSSVVKWLPEEKRSSHLIFESPVKLTSQWQDFEFTFTPQANGKVRLMLRSGWTKKPLAGWVHYDHLQVTGARVDNPSFELTYQGVIAGWMLRDTNLMLDKSDAAVGKNYIRAAHDFQVRQDIAVTAGKPVTVKFKARNGGVQTAPKVTPMHFRNMSGKDIYATFYPKSYYRFYNSQVKYLPLKDKGITPEMINHEPNPVPGFCPEAQYIIPESDRLPQADVVRIPVELLEENGVARTAFVRSGIPVARGALFELNHIRVLDPAGKTVPAQFSALGFWPDKSVKWILVQFNAPLKAREKAVYTVEFGKNIASAPKSASMLKVNGDQLLIDTGVLTAVIDKKKFALVENVKVNGKFAGTFSPDGLTLVTENGQKLASSGIAPEKVTILEDGSQRLQIKVQGQYSSNSPGTYTAFISFTRNSAVVDMMINHTNTNLQHEFTDITSLSMNLQSAAAVKTLTMDKISVPAGKRLFQKEEYVLAVDGKDQRAALSGAGEAVTAGGRVTFALQDAAFRYPKAFNTSGRNIGIELLPEMPDAKFGTHLPYYLQFPFCEGKYRLKWGMGFTEKIKIDFSGSSSAAQLGAMDIVPVIGRDYLASTKAIPGVFPASNTMFDVWDNSAITAFYRHMTVKARVREYGFLNYGDWFGERGRNWTNNEYDLPHGLFMLFARTGNRDVFRWAVTGARHQADVDIIHAYPDPYYIGANAQHGVGHTGVNHQRHINPATWSYPVDYSFRGAAGHTWSQGMLETWCFTGDPRVMDTALKLGEHLVRYTAPRLTRLSTHERSAGWSGKALLAYYHVTGDKKYLDATKLLVNVALKEQKFDKGGAWPHKMPKDHSGGFKNAYGNTPFLIGTLLAMLRDYHMITGDPAVARSIISGAGWQQRSWDNDSLGFPYALSWDNKPYFAPGFGTSTLATPGVSYRAILTGDQYGYHIAKSVLDVQTTIGISPIGKPLSMVLCYAGDIFEDIVRFQEKYSAAPYAFNAGNVLKSLKKKDDTFNLRGPDRKEFRIVLNDSASELIIKRKRTGARPESKPQWQYRITAPDGSEIAAVNGSVKEDYYTGKFKISGKKGDVFTMTINDDMTGHWNIMTAPTHAVFVKVVPLTSVSGASPARFFFTVPAGTQEFSLDISGVHLGAFRAWIIDENHREIAQVAGVNDGKPLLPWLKPVSNPTQRMTVKLPAPLKQNKVWKLLILTGGDARIAMNGIPPWLAVIPVECPEFK